MGAIWGLVDNAVVKLVVVEATESAVNVGWRGTGIVAFIG